MYSHFERNQTLKHSFKNSHSRPDWEILFSGPKYIGLDGPPKYMFNPKKNSEDNLSVVS